MVVIVYTTCASLSTSTFAYNKTKTLRWEIGGSKAISIDIELSEGQG